MDRKNRLEEKVKQMQKLSPLASTHMSSRVLKCEEVESTVEELTDIGIAVNNSDINFVKKMLQNELSSV